MNPDIDPVILANTKFSIDLLKELCTKNTENVIFSPLSISSALGLVLLGAKNNTATQMYKALHFGQMRIMYHYLYEELYKEGEYKNKEPDKEGEYKNKEPHNTMKRSLQLANRLYGEKTVDFNDDYLDFCEEWCFASLRTVDFKNNPDAAIKKINDWVKNICDKMDDVLDKDDVSKDTSLALISAVYFKKKWVKAFFPLIPKKGEKVNWPMMDKTDKLPLGTIPHRQYGTKDTKARILEIPYENNHLSMLIILPNEKEDLQKLVDSITYEKIVEWTEPDNMLPTDVYVKIPSFKLQEKYDLEKALKDLGITDLFSDKCDLSGIAPGKLKLSKVVHKYFIDVDMEGTDAEAGSGDKVDQTDGKEILESFIVESPFLFFIRHNSTKSILFWGRVTTLPPTPVI